MVDRNVLLGLKRDDNTIDRSEILKLALSKFHDSWEFDKRNKGNGTISRAYPFSNENLTSLFSRIDCKDKRVAAVSSSIDYALNAIYNGAIYVTVMDANVYTLPFGEYKRAVIRSTDYDEFQTFIANPKAMMAWPVMNRAIDNMSPDVKAFWQELSGLYEDAVIGKEEIDDIDYSFGIQMLNNDVKTREINSPFYCDKYAYNKLRDILDGVDIDYVVSSMSDFSNDINGVYDVILLSNVYKYVHEQGFFGDGGVRGLYNNHLSDGGIVQLHSIMGEYVEHETPEECVTRTMKDMDRFLAAYKIGGKLEAYAMDELNTSILLTKEEHQM